MNTRSEPETFATPTEGEYVLPLRELFRILLRRLWVIVVVTVVFCGAAVGLSLTQAPVYQASVQMLVGQERGLEGNAGNIVALQDLTQTMAAAIDSRPVAEGVIERLDLEMTPEELLRGLNAEPLPETQFVQIYYDDEDPEVARDVANGVGLVFSEQISDVSPGASDITATVWEQATTPDAPVSPEPVRNGVLALMLGLFLGLGLAFLLEYLDDGWGSPEEAERVSGIPTFGVIPSLEIPKAPKGTDKTGDKAGDLSRPLVTATNSTGSSAKEAFRSLRTNLLYGFVDDPPQVITVTSPGGREGKSTICANLGVVLSQADKKTLIVDCDLRKPVIHRIFGVRNIRGLVNVLVGQNALYEVYQEPPAANNLKIIPVGHMPPNPAEFLGSSHFAAFLSQAREEFDYILLDTPPVQPVSDPAILASQADGVFLVVDAQKTRKGAVRESIRSLEGVGANILGTILNNFEAPKGDYTYYSDYTYKK